MFQGGREADRKNREALAFDVREVDFVLLTHAHIDHSGLLPRLVLLGFRGPDSVHDPDGRPAARDAAGQRPHPGGRGRARLPASPPRHRTRDREATPLYTVVQAMASLKRLRTVEYGDTITPHPHVTARFVDAGHILGSSIVEVTVDEGRGARRIVFSGDLGQPGHPLMRDPEFVEQADVLVMESTYGNRLHRPMRETLDELAEVVTETLTVRRATS